MIMNRCREFPGDPVDEEVLDRIHKDSKDVIEGLKRMIMRAIPPEDAKQIKDLIKYIYSDLTDNIMMGFNLTPDNPLTQETLLEYLIEDIPYASDELKNRQLALLKDIKKEYEDLKKYQDLIWKQQDWQKKTDTHIERAQQKLEEITKQLGELPGTSINIAREIDALKERLSRLKEEKQGLLNEQKEALKHGYDDTLQASLITTKDEEILNLQNEIKKLEGKLKNAKELENLFATNTKTDPELNFFILLKQEIQGLEKICKSETIDGLLIMMERPFVRSLKIMQQLTQSQEKISKVESSTLERINEEIINVINSIAKFLHIQHRIAFHPKIQDQIVQQEPSAELQQFQGMVKKGLIANINIGDSEKKVSGVIEKMYTDAKQHLEAEKAAEEAKAKQIAEEAAKKAAEEAAAKKSTGQVFSGIKKGLSAAGKFLNLSKKGEHSSRKKDAEEDKEAASNQDSQKQRKGWLSKFSRTEKSLLKDNTIVPKLKSARSEDYRNR